MTELEKQLLSVLEQLQQDYSQRLDEWESAFAEWRSMCGLMQTGERGAERARVGLEHAGAEFKRAAAPLVRELNAIELRQRENEYQKTLELERQPQKTYRGPTL
ncbi:MbeD/MobD like [Enterobacter hormaechei]|nr:MbeD/MobD like [Enterobacter hormaechei]